MNMKNVIACPFCDGSAILQKDIKEIVYRKEAFKVLSHYYKCNSCREEFTTTETDTITMSQVYNQYRERYFIPFPEQIISIREKYELSASKMSEVLGLGINGYGNYEKGEIPTPAIGNLISNAENPTVFRLMLEKAKHHFSNGMFDTAFGKVQFLIEQEKCGHYQMKLNSHVEPNSLTGFKTINKAKLANILVAFITKCRSEYNDRIKLNKLLFYADFLSYKLTGFSINGLSYRAIQYGPVPTYYDQIYTCLETEGSIISNWMKEPNGSAKESFLTDEVFDPSMFTSTEQYIIEKITTVFKDVSSWDLVELSHCEKGWIDLHTEKKIIDYQTYAFDLEGIKLS